MPFSEDDLRAALKRKDPGSGFTQRVMSRLSQQEKTASSSERPGGWLTWLRPLKLYPAMAAVAAVLVLTVGSWMGYERYQAIKITDAQRERQEALHAEQQAILAIRITNAKLNHVFKRVKQSEASDPKIRREIL